MSEAEPRALTPDDQEFVIEMEHYLTPDAAVPLFFNEDGSLDRGKIMEQPCFAPRQIEGLSAPPEEAPAPAKTPYTTGISAITYPCGCEATGPGNLPEHCPDHPDKQIHVFKDGHGTPFDPNVHAVNAHDGAPKLDSANKLIRKEHDYAGPVPSKNFGS